MNRIIIQIEGLKNQAEITYDNREDNESIIAEILNIENDILVKLTELQQKRDSLLILLFSKANPNSETDQTMNFQQYEFDISELQHLILGQSLTSENTGQSTDLTDLTSLNIPNLDTILGSMSQFNLEGLMKSMPTTEDISHQISSFAKNLGRDFGQGLGQGLSGMDISSSMQYDNNNGNTPSGVLTGNVSYSATPLEPLEDNKTKHCITNHIGEKCIIVGPGIIQKV
jgi:hypothetical protein